MLIRKLVVINTNSGLAYKDTSVLRVGHIVLGNCH